MPAKRVRKKEAETVDHDLSIWARLGGGELAPERELTPGERIMAAGNEWVREQLQPTALRISPLAFNPFRRDR
jgi:hypothetical protein